MARASYYGGFASLTFPKSGSDIIAKATALRERLAAKNAEREQRIKTAADEMGLHSAGDVFLSLQAIADGSSGAGDINMNVGIAAKVRSEIGELSKGRAEVDQLRLIIDNLPPGASFDLKFDELTYFEF